MNEDIAKNRRNICLLAVFLLGNLIISFPKGEGTEQSFWGYIVVLLLGIMVGVWFAFLQHNNKTFGTEYLIGLSGKNVVIKLLFIFWCYIVFITCCKDYIVMIDRIRLPKTPITIISVIYLLVILLLSAAKKEVILLFAFTNFILIFLGAVLMFLFSVPLFNFEYFIDSLQIDFKNTLNQGLTFYIHSFGQTLICLLFIGYTKKQYAVKNTLCGILLGGLIFLICFLNIILMVGNSLLPKLLFPYANVTGMLVAGENYNRLDVITYYIYFICNLIKSAVILKVIRESFKKGKIVNIFAIIIPVISAIIFSCFSPLGQLLHSDFVNLTVLIIEIMFPIILTVHTLRRK